MNVCQLRIQQLDWGWLKSKKHEIYKAIFNNFILQGRGPFLPLPSFRDPLLSIYSLPPSITETPLSWQKKRILLI